MQVAGIVLCGGKSTRMGLAKATLPFGPELMLERVLRLLGQAVQPLVLVAAPSQRLPILRRGIRIARDQHKDRGPLEAIHAGLTAIEDCADAAYVTSCDVPLLRPDFVLRVVELLAEHQVAVPVEGTFHHPLAAVYRTSVLPNICSLLAADRRRPVYLFDEVATCRIDVDQLRDVDPQLHTLMNLNQPADYFAALQTAGFAPAPQILSQLGKLRTPARRDTD